MVTGLEMCETIFQAFIDSQPELLNGGISPMTLWNYSPTGELLQVFLWYNEAIAYFWVMYG